jgi:hypothetical protein
MGQFRGAFDRELEAIEAKVIELLGMVVEDLAVATEALLGGRRETAGVLAGRERLTDTLYVEIEDLAARAILLQAPVALDLAARDYQRLGAHASTSHDAWATWPARQEASPPGADAWSGSMPRLGLTGPALSTVSPVRAAAASRRPRGASGPVRYRTL